ncbi:poly-beta-1,6-N-acetyl-D-glucosamine N-deacetylase PgaB [soil metagenome]
MNSRYTAGIFIAALALVGLLAMLGGCGSGTGGGASPSPSPSPENAPSPGHGTPALTILSYHDVRDDIEGDLDPDRFAVSTARLVEHFEWFRAEGFTPVSLDQVIAAHEGRGALPARPVLLVFDDGLRSVYTRVFPLLELYAYPALVAVVGAWQDAPEGWTLDYDGLGELGPEGFVSWDELREMQASGLVEVATHTWDLHEGVLGNPFGNEQPAAVTRIFDPESRGYEADPAYLVRIRSDLERASLRIEEEMGRAPRAVVWPYGEYSQVTESLARELGMPVSIGLVPGAQPLDRLDGMKRFVVSGNPTVEDLAWFLRRSTSAVSPVRVVHVDLDYVYDDDQAQMERNLDALLDRIVDLGPSHVYLQAFADPGGDGTARELYFPNRHLAVRSDLFNRVAWQLRTRAGVRVFAWMPLLAFDLGDAERNDALSVRRWESGTAVPSRPDYWRLSPFEPEARRIISEIYEDLARHAAFDGVLFHDDAYLNDREDAAAFPGEPGRLPSARERTDALFDLTDEMMQVVRRHRPTARSARNLYARVVLEPESEAWFAQNFVRSLDHYDHTAVMAMPYMEGARNADRWLDGLLDRVAAVPGGLAGTVFELQSVDWRTQQPIPAEELAGWMRRLERRGAIHFGYYPDDFIRGLPAVGPVREALSVERDPWARGN